MVSCLTSNVALGTKKDMLIIKKEKNAALHFLLITLCISLIP